jgi:hypothetical protein
MSKTGWVIQDMHLGTKEKQVFVGKHGVSVYEIEDATVHRTRKEARESSLGIENDVVRKVELDDEGKAVKVIPGR